MTEADLAMTEMTEDQLAAAKLLLSEVVTQNEFFDEAKPLLAALLAEVDRLTTIQREIEARPEWRLRVDLSHAQHQIQVEQGERFKYGKALEVADAEIASLRAFRGRVAAMDPDIDDLDHGLRCFFCGGQPTSEAGGFDHAPDCLYLEATA